MYCTEIKDLLLTNKCMKIYKVIVLYYNSSSTPVLFIFILFILLFEMLAILEVFIVR